MKPSLKQAIAAHQAGKLDVAEQIYRSLLDSANKQPAIFQNLGALLRNQRKTEEALKIYELGLAAFPDEPGILSNRANILKDSKPATALTDLLKALQKNPTLINSWITAFSLLDELGCHSYLLYYVSQALSKGVTDIRVLTTILDILASHPECDDSVDTGFVLDYTTKLLAAAKSLPLVSRIDTTLGLGTYMAEHGDCTTALTEYANTLSLVQASLRSCSEQDKKAIEKSVINNSWNLGCTLLKQGEFTEGWRLYDYGLRVPTESAQMWQRALRKPFSNSELKVWRGEPLIGKRLCVLEEQGIGDTMMFLTLLPSLAEEAEQIDVIMSGRLVPLYRKSLQDIANVISYDDLPANTISPSPYDFQTALGSIPQYRFKQLQDYAKHVPMLRHDQIKASRMRQQYLSDKPNPKGKSKIIGISWQGGGNKARIKQKSMPKTFFLSMLEQIEDCIFVSLQYGDVHQTVRSWQNLGIPVIYDPDVDALADMDAWLNQVAACDAVISVANTTIHGAGGLNIPTLCLLSLQADWRWLNDPSCSTSYWYPSVEITRESKIAGWQPAVDRCLTWIAQLS